jgi:predicted DsbA family dithiol-disulfide isomerase
MTLSRRELLTLGGAAAGFAALAGGAFALWPRAPLVFEAVQRPAGFRRIASASAGISSFVTGIGVSEPSVPLTQDHLCQIANRGQPEVGKLTIASFSDYFCPYCRVLDQQVHDIAAGDPNITLVPHQVPLLGRASDLAARGAIAAQNQGAYEAYFKRLIRTTFVPNPAYLRDFAGSQNLDVDGFVFDLTSPETNDQLASSRAVFRAFGFVGTPGLMVGRTLVNGEISLRDLRALCADELASTDQHPCVG